MREGKNMIFKEQWWVLIQKHLTAAEQKEFLFYLLQYIYNGDGDAKARLLSSQGWSILFDIIVGK